MSSRRNKRVVITGVGPLSSIGSGKGQLWESICSQSVKVEKEKFRFDNDVLDSYYLHKVKNFNINNYGINPQRLNEIKDWKNSEDAIDLWYLLATCKMALDDSGLSYDPNYNDIGLILSHENPGIHQFVEDILNKTYELLWKNNRISKRDYFLELYQKYKKKVYDLQTFMFLFHIAKALGLHGCSLFLNNACASGLYSLEMASLLIKSDQCSSVVVGAADHPDIFKFLWFKQLEIYSGDGNIKPFSSNSSGFAFGDGGAALVLEDFESARKRKANIYAEYVSGAFGLEGWKVVWPAVVETYYRDVIIKALKRSGLTSDKIDLVVPHGVGVEVIDRYEAKSLVDVFNTKPYFSVFKPYVGHNLGGSTLLETVILLLAIANNKIPPALNCKNDNQKIKIEFITDFLNEHISYAMKTSTAFAGFDAAIVLRNLNK